MRLYIVIDSAIDFVVVFLLRLERLISARDWYMTLGATNSAEFVHRERRVSLVPQKDCEKNMSYARRHNKRAV